MPIGIACVLGVILGIVLTVLAYVFLMNEKKISGLNSFWYQVHKILNFKVLIVEKIIKLFYVISTCIIITIGFFMLFSVKDNGYGYYDDKVWMGGYGLLLMILGPIVIRICYELSMMFIILVENTIAIREKLIVKNESVNSETIPNKKSSKYVFCTECGERYDEENCGCPKCTKTDTKTEETKKTQEV